MNDAAGQWLSEPDLGDKEARVAFQCDGEVHFDEKRPRTRSDVMRDELTREQDWQVAVITAIEDRHPHLLVARAVEVYRRAARMHGRHVLPPFLR